MLRIIFGLLASIICNGAGFSICATSSILTPRCQLMSPQVVMSTDNLSTFTRFDGVKAWDISFYHPTFPSSGSSNTRELTFIWQSGTESRIINNWFPNVGSWFSMWLPVQDWPYGPVLMELRVVDFDNSGTILQENTGNYFTLFQPVPEPSTSIITFVGIACMAALLFLRASMVREKVPPSTTATSTT